MKKAKNRTTSDIEKLLTPLPRILQVSFALYCARDVIENIKDKNIYNEVSAVLLTLHRYIKGEAVTQKDLEEVNNAAYAAYAASAANAASAVHSAASAASAAYNAAHAAYNAAYSAAYSAVSAAHSAAYNAAYQDKINEYYAYLVTEIAKLSLLERLVYTLKT